MTVCVCLQSLIDDAELQTIQSVALRVKEQVAFGDSDAINTYVRLYRRLQNYTNCVDYYNFLVFDKPCGATDKRMYNTRKR